MHQKSSQFQPQTHSYQNVIHKQKCWPNYASEGIEILKIMFAKLFLVNLFCVLFLSFRPSYLPVPNHCSSTVKYNRRRSNKNYKYHVVIYSCVVIRKSSYNEYVFIFS